MAKEMAAAISRPHLLRGMGLVDATALVVGSMIGSGIFIVSAESGRVAGSPGWLLSAWAVAGVLAVRGALSSPVSGGQRLFTIGPVSVSAVQAVGLLVIAVLTASNATGLKTGILTQNVFTFAKFAALF